MRKTSLFASLVCVLMSTCALGVGGDMGGADPNGSPEKPYLIEDLADFDVFASNSATYWAAGVHTKLTTDIDLSGRTYTTAVIAPDTDSAANGFQGTEFLSVFNGNGHIIWNLKIEGGINSYLGLFGSIGRYSEILQLGLENVSATGYSYIGGFAGSNQGSIEECYSKGSVIGSGDYIGGFVGVNQSFGIILFCYTEGNVEGNQYVGGFTGQNEFWIDGAYSTTQVQAIENTGAFIGEDISSVMILPPLYRNFYDKQKSGIDFDDIALGFRTSDLYNLYTYGRWTCGESGTKWNISNLNDYPRLHWENKDGVPINTASIWPGQGTKVDPYLIYSAGAFHAMGGYVDCILDKHFKLMNDIDLSAYDGQEGRPALHPVAGAFYYKSNPGAIDFIGSFNGNFHTIRNVNIDSDSERYPSLFGTIGENGLIENLYIDNISLVGHSCAALALSLNFEGIIRNCRANVNLSYFDSGFTGGQIGGLVCGNQGLIKQCSVTGSITINGISTEHAGGIVGHNDGVGSIVQCYSDVNISGPGTIGGIAAINHDTISQCYASGSLNNYNSAGALIAESDYGGIVTDSFFLDTSGPNNGYGTPLDDPNMMIQANFTGWDFDPNDGDPADWMMLRPGEDYPRLAWQEVFDGDIAGLYGADMVDFAYLANYWGLDCNSNDCGRADIDASGDVGLGDLVYVGQDWLK